MDIVNNVYQKINCNFKVVAMIRFLIVISNSDILVLNANAVL